MRWRLKNRRLESCDSGTRGPAGRPGTCLGAKPSWEAPASSVDAGAAAAAASGSHIPSAAGGSSDGFEVGRAVERSIESTLSKFYDMCLSEPADHEAQGWNVAQGVCIRDILGDLTGPVMGVSVSVSGVLVHGANIGPEDHGEDSMHIGFDDLMNIRITCVPQGSGPEWWPAMFQIGHAIPRHQAEIRQDGAMAPPSPPSPPSPAAIPAGSRPRRRRGQRGGAASVVAGEAPSAGGGRVRLRRAFSIVRHYSRVFEFKSDPCEQCTICLESLQVRQKVRALPCFHRFHDKCSVWFYKTRGVEATCPICRIPVDEVYQHIGACV